MVMMGLIFVMLIAMIHHRIDFALCLDDDYADDDDWRKVLHNANVLLVLADWLSRLAWPTGLLLIMPRCNNAHYKMHTSTIFDNNDSSSSSSSCTSAWASSRAQNICTNSFMQFLFTNFVLTTWFAFPTVKIDEPSFCSTFLCQKDQKVNKKSQISLKHFSLKQDGSIPHCSQ